jgi:hypothetical protein
MQEDSTTNEVFPQNDIPTIMVFEKDFNSHNPPESRQHFDVWNFAKANGDRHQRGVPPERYSNDELPFKLEIFPV